MFFISKGGVPSSLKSLEMVDWAQYDPIRAFKKVLFMFKLIYTCRFTRLTPKLTKTIIMTYWSQNGPIRIYSIIYRCFIQV